MLPTKTTKMCLWTLQQDESFYEKNKSPMFDLLSTELQLTSEQSQKIQERRFFIVIIAFFHGGLYYGMLIIIIIIITITTIIIITYDYCYYSLFFLEN
jgi:hypothetical protein